MRTVKFSSLLLICAFVAATFILSGCPDANELRIQNADLYHFGRGVSFGYADGVGASASGVMRTGMDLAV